MPTKSEFESMFKSSITKLSAAIVGREKTDEILKPTAKSKREKALVLNRMPVNTSEGMFDFKFVIHAGCPCSAISSSVETATFENVTMAPGPRAGQILGIDGTGIGLFYAYKAL